MIILNNLKSIVALLVGAILVFLFMKNCSGTKSTDAEVKTEEKTVVVKMVTKVDTLYVKKYIHRVDTIVMPTVVRVDTVFIKDTKQVASIPDIKRVYKDKIKVADSVSVSYVADVTGTLDKISLEYDDKRAERTIVRNVEKEVTVTDHIKPSGLYVGVGSNLGLTELSPFATYVNNKNSFTVKYNVASKIPGVPNIGIAYSRRLF